MSKETKSLSTVKTIFSIDIIQSFKEIDYDVLINHIKSTGKPAADEKYDTKFEDTYFDQHDLMDEIIDHARDCVKEQLNVSTAVSGQPWVHIHEKNMSTNTHTHGSSNISVVYYLATPEGSGDIFFNPDPNFINPTAFIPQRGGMLLFPGWLKHSVTRNTSEDQRISVSFNLNYTSEEA